MVHIQAFAYFFCGLKLQKVNRLGFTLRDLYITLTVLSSLQAEVSLTLFIAYIHADHYPVLHTKTLLILVKVSSAVSFLC